MTFNFGTLVPLASVALKATVLLALAAILDYTILRRASAAARHQLWTFAVVGVLILPALFWGLPSWRAVVPGISAVRVTEPGREPSLTPVAAADRDVARPSSSMSVSSAVQPIATKDRAASPVPRVVPWARLVLAMYVAGVLLMLARVVREQVYVRRLARRADTEHDNEWTALVGVTAARLGIRRRIGLLRSTEPMMPITWGIVRPFVMVPAGSSSWPVARREAVLVHELSHVARHDCLTQTIAAVACALYWPHPGVWFAARRLRVERELACDDQVVSGGIGARDYAGHLLEIARTLRPPRPLAALAVGMATSSHIEMRLRAAIDDARPRTAPGRRVTLMSAMLATVLLLPLAAFRVATMQSEPGVRQLPRVFVTAIAPAEAPVAQPPIAQRTLGGTYDIRLAEAGEAGLGGVGTVIHISMFTPGMNTFYTPLSAFAGLSITQMEAADLAAEFTLRRGPGTFTFAGTLNRGQGKGRFTFVPDPAFTAELVKRGMQAPTDEQQFTLARHGVGLEMLDELAAQEYATPTTAALVRASSSGADLDELRALASLGYAFGTLESVTQFHSNGVSSEYIRELGNAGYRRLTPVELMQARNADLTADFANKANAGAGRRLSISELVSQRSRGEASASDPASSPAAVSTPTPGAAQAPAAPTALTGKWAIANTGGPEMKLDIEWDGNNQWARPINASDLPGFSATAAAGPTPVAFRLEQDAGVFQFEGTFQSGRGSGRFRFEPNHAFAATVRSLGVQDVDDLSDHELKNLAFGGMSATAIREIIALGITPLTRHDLVDMAVRQVTPAYVRGLRAAGLPDGTTAADIIGLRFSGATPAYVSEMAALGYRRLSISQIIDLWRAGVTPAFIRLMQSAGYKEPTPETLIDLRRRR
jgi:beta-lactamase regulating signal transducer with metallopeptidase domain